MQNKVNHRLYYEQEDLDVIFDNISPFNMTNDIKRLNKERILKQVLIELEDTILQKQYIILQEKKFDNRFVRLVKVKISNPNNNRGKRSGLRCICKVDGLNNVSYFLTIYAVK